MRFVSTFFVLIVKGDEEAAPDVVLPKPQSPNDPGVGGGGTNCCTPYSKTTRRTITLKIRPQDLESLFDEALGIMHVDLWLRYAWTDSRLKWDNETTGIGVLRVPPKIIWTPDFTFYNSSQVNKDMNCWDSNVLIYANGEVLWVPPCQVSAHCNITLSKHPYGEQECMMKFGSWTFDGFTMGLEFYNQKEKADLADYEGTKYKVTKNEAVKEKYYECCEELYLILQYNLGFTRNAECQKNVN